MKDYILYKINAHKKFEEYTQEEFHAEIEKNDKAKESRPKKVVHDIGKVLINSTPYLSNVENTHAPNCPCNMCK